MLVLERDEGRKIHILLEDGRKIIICLTKVTSSHSAKIGFVAPRTMRILRDEHIGLDGEPTRP